MNDIKLNQIINQIKEKINESPLTKEAAFNLGATLMYYGQELCAESGCAIKPGDEDYRKMVSDISKLVNAPELK